MRMRMRPTSWAAALALLLVAASLPGGPPAGAESDEQWDYTALAVSGHYEPLGGDFAGDFASDIYWYAPGSGTDTLYIGTAGERVWTKRQFPMNDDAVPVVGDFGGDVHDDILWYRPGPSTDRLWIATGDSELFDTTRTVTLNGDYRPEVLRDWRDGKKDRVFWYRPGEGTDPLWIFKPDATFTTVTSQIRNTLQVVPGDWSGDGVEDLLLYGPGSLPDRVWTSHAGAFTSKAITINGRYQAVTVLALPYDEVVLFGTGAKEDRYLHNSGSGFQIQPIFLPARGKAVSAGIGAAIVYSPLDPENIVVDFDGTAETFLLSESRDVGANKVLLVGNFENDDFFDLLWYGPGPAHDEIWYGHNDELAGASIAVQKRDVLRRR
jgi:hypothetical protein